MITLCGIYDGLNTKPGRLRSLNTGFAQLDGALCRHFCPELVAWLNQVPLTDIPSDAYLHHLNQFIMRLKAENIWQLLDRLWIFATEYRSNARISLVNPNGMNATWPTNITEVSSPSWIALQGYAGNGSSSYLNTNYNPATNAVNYLVNNASFGTYSLTNIENNGVTMGNWNTSNNFGGGIWPYYTSGSADALFAINAIITSGGGYVIPGVIGSSLGLWAVQTTSTTAAAGIVNGKYYTGTLTNSKGIASVSYFICGMNESGSVTYPDTRKIAMAFSGSGAIDQTALYRVHQSFAEKIGYNV